MTSQSKQAGARQGEATIRGRMVSLTVVELVDNDVKAIGHILGEKMSQASDFFHNAPLLFDFQNFVGDYDISLVESMYRISLANRFTPVGITGVSSSLKNEAKFRGIAVWPSSGAVRQPMEKEISKEQATIEEPDLSQVEEQKMTDFEKPEEPKEEPKEEIAIADGTSSGNAQTLVVRQPVRSGQKVYARGGDLIVMSSVSTGAEVLADGHVHVYGTLRGRAIAGASGREDARIFCQDLRADLIAIAGFYMTNDDLSEDIRDSAVQICLHQEQLRIEPL